MWNRNYDNWFDNKYAKDLHRFSLIFPNYETFQSAVGGLITPLYDNDFIAIYLPLIYNKLNAKYSNSYFIYKNIFNIYERLVEQVIDVALSFYTNLNAIKNYGNDDNPYTSLQVVKNYGADNTEEDQIQKQYFENGSETASLDLDKISALNEQKNTILNNLNTIFKNAGRMFMLLDDPKILTVGGDE